MKSFGRRTAWMGAPALATVLLLATAGDAAPAPLTAAAPPPLALRFGAIVDPVAAQAEIAPGGGAGALTAAAQASTSAPTGASAAATALAGPGTAPPAAAAGRPPGNRLDQLIAMLELLVAHGFRTPPLADFATPAGATAVAGAPAPDTRPVGASPSRALGESPRALVLSFDGAFASFATHVLPLLEAYDLRAVLAIDPAWHDAAASHGGVAILGWDDLRRVVASARVDVVPLATVDATTPRELSCGPRPPANGPVDGRLSGLAAALTQSIARLRAELGITPRGVAWPAGAFDGEVEAVARRLGLEVQLISEASPRLALAPPRIARLEVGPDDGIDRVVYAAARFDPRASPVRYLDLDLGTLCRSATPRAELDRVVAAVRALGLNGVRLSAVDARQRIAWYPSRRLTTGGDVLAPTVDALHAAGVTWVAVETPADETGGVELAAEVAREAPLDLAILPDGGAGAAIREAVRWLRPLAGFASDQATGVADDVIFERRAIADRPAREALPARQTGRAITLQPRPVDSPPSINDALLAWSAAGVAWLGLPWPTVAEVGVAALPEMALAEAPVRSAGTAGAAAAAPRAARAGGGAP